VVPHVDHPHDIKKVVMSARTQPGVAYLNMVSRTLEACDVPTVRAVEQAIPDVSSTDFLSIKLIGHRFMAIPSPVRDFGDR